MSHRALRLIPLAVLALTSTAAFAGPFSGASSGAADVTSLAAAAGAVLGGAVTVIGGAIAAWKAAHGQPWTGALACAIAGAAIAAVSVI